MAFCRYLTFTFGMYKFHGTIFSLSVPIEFLSNNILISMKKDAEHISVNTARATTQINGFTYIMSEAAEFSVISLSQHFRKYQWKSLYFSNDCLGKLYL